MTSTEFSPKSPADFETSASQQRMPIGRFMCSKVPNIMLPGPDSVPTTTPSTSSSSSGYESLNIPDMIPKISTDNDSVISFRYKWSLKIATRLIGPSDKAILHVSPAFCTAFNGVQFTWLIRMCDENLFEIKNDGPDFPGVVNREKRVNITLYYKDGPALDVKLESVKIFIDDSEKKRVFSGMPLEGLEYTKGSGGFLPTPLPNLNGTSNGKTPLNLPKFSQFIYANVGKQISVTVQLRIHSRWFQPLNYLTNLDHHLMVGNRLEELCRQVLKDIKVGQLIVPDNDKYALHRHIFLFASREIFERSQRDDSTVNEFDLSAKIETVLAHIYFDEVLAGEAECFEDFVAILEASFAVHFPKMKRECERFICREVMLESADLQFAKKTLLLAERYDLPILKMVSFGVIVDRLLVKMIPEDNCSGIVLHQHSNTSTESTVAESVQEIREELLQIAEQITTGVEEEWNDNSDSQDHDSDLNSDILDCDSDDDEDHSKSDYRDTLVGSVIGQLEELAKHIRKVSMPPGISPAPVTPNPLEGTEYEEEQPSYLHVNDGHLECCSSPTLKALNFESRRSSLKTSRNHLVSTSPTFNSHSSNFSFASQLSNVSHTEGHTSSTLPNSKNPASPKQKRNTPRRRSVMFSLPATRDENLDPVIRNDSDLDDNDSLNEATIQKIETKHKGSVSSNKTLKKISMDNSVVIQKFV